MTERTPERTPTPATRLRTASLSGRRWLRGALAAPALLVSISLAAGCAGADEPDAAELATAQQGIVNGTREPTITNLSPGEELAIGYLATDSTGPFCTATLIDRDVAITAQHCIDGTYPVERMRFGMGDPGSPLAYIPVHSAPVHGTRDVALLFLTQDAVSLVPNAEPLPFNRTAPSQSLIGTNAEAAGYGETHTAEDGRFYVQVQLTDIQADWIVVDGHGQRGICFGDSGGPLFIHVGNGEPVIAGVESHGDSSCVDQDFETRLDMATDWIDQQMGNFDPQAPPQTGTTGGGGDEICVPWFQVPAGNGEVKCADGEVALCSASPARPNGLWLAPVAPLALLALARRRRPRHAGSAKG
jgi:hypothetical protein